MRVLLLIDRNFAKVELPMIRTLGIGLVDADVRTTVALPSDMLDTMTDVFGFDVVGYRDRGAAWTRGLRAREILDEIEAEDREPMVVHAFGSRSYAISANVASNAGSALVLEVRSRHEVPRACSFVKERHTNTLLLTPSPTLTRALIAEGASSVHMREVPWGVSPAEPIEAHKNGVDFALVLGGPGSNPHAWASALRGLAAVASRREDFMIFADASAMQRTRADPLVGSLGLSPLLSRIPNLEANRELALRADVLIWPDHAGEYHSLVLDAMARGMVVIASEDDAIPAISDPSRAFVVAGSASDWSTAIGSVLEDETLRTRIGSAARIYIREHHRVSRHITGLLDAYEWMTGRDALPMGKAPT
ncbi:MAG TPA: hypothetical protein ENJ00_01405 [Phycisphaerales bacterium]|nr:hypothetical protein [Phycisphaerales bacterium]